MTEEIDAILFDAGGTLIEVKPSRPEVFSQALKANGFEADVPSVWNAMVRAEREFDAEFALLDGKDEAWFWKKYDAFVAEQLGFKGDLSRLEKDISSRFDQIVPDVKSWVAYPDARPALEGLRKRDFRLGVVSNATDLARKVLDNLGLSKYFDFMVLSDEVGSRKPSPEIFRIALKAAGTRPNRAVYVGDKYSVDVVGASRAGMLAVLLDRDDIYPSADCIRARDLGFFRRFY
jgi:putative hydrolase of the HAD superfamily